ncbi:glutamate N-acetyltransferase [Schizosaccharomyces japonicus yFS275]|uniref:Arginine biosynthesis bifunctional protein ArgJ, mitochondrial n=1 Tax=Schizosaccharomyces japonicus (strain yFS275 / FY16936) TaxID=402676 RepID=ARGJ_SCHJY|nr:glutamate N-acetyltransferase [Schizosaccharomyces japonicus yFS275]B6JYD2.1 RecName: Full=Arginine biosynthesis bifunctional protein ArgJ, mitochondrial; Includes: RecName: Full=Glutamate N-acetyltransferase; Short=GAT; AltName: Full=Ornithine acetyltransferase; Short=OATase; AltName: Full=Ornithine transacetylase; Includes: RecName: Full=Amino-acid acetyltransferase; AltName: Full=N-acetylglutamate synthase; Short=AGS; Contains: RecName: Full=Arginine biosynthesis bifunctional protein ArgJ al
MSGLMFRFPFRRFVATMPDKTKYIAKSGTYPKGFLINGVSSGVKAKGALDLTMLVSEKPCNAAAVFTKNAFQAAPVRVSRETLQQTKGQGIQCLVVNSGCANAVTGSGGVQDARLITALADKAVLGRGDGGLPSTLVMSTGVIGQRLKMDKISSGVMKAIEGLGSSHEHWMRGAKAICTTDTFPKVVSQEFSVNGQTYRIAGLAKGAGMINPNLATLLGFFATDAPVAVEAVQQILREAVDKSFNAISIDGDTSTNDTIAFLANGASGGPEIDVSSPAYEELKQSVTGIAQKLSQLVVRDGEGATKFVTIRVRGAATEADAKLVAATISNSALVKTAFFGEDANWGRILCAIGYSGAIVNPKATSVSFVPADQTESLRLLVLGEPQNVDEERASEILSHDEFGLDVDLGSGNHETVSWTCDFSYEYVRINADYRS